MSRPVALAVLVLGLALGSSARAREPEHVTKSRKIALEAADDLDAKRFADALVKVTEAEDLYHAPTHLLMRAEALEGLGRLAEALEIYERLAAEPLGPTAPPAFRKARVEGAKRERALLAWVPSLLVVVTGAPSEEVTATVDGEPLALVPDLAGVSGVSLGCKSGGGGHSCVVLAGGAVRCFGANAFGELGIGNKTNQSTPQVVNLPPVAEVALGVQFTCARLVSGAVRCWGRNDLGQLGIGEKGAEQTSPVPVVFP